jgi:hypothetical protein
VKMFSGLPPVRMQRRCAHCTTTIVSSRTTLILLGWTMSVYGADVCALTLHIKWEATEILTSICARTPNLNNFSNFRVPGSTHPAFLMILVLGSSVLVPNLSCPTLCEHTGGNLLCVVLPLDLLLPGTTKVPDSVDSLTYSTPTVYTTCCSCLLVLSTL